MKTFGIADPFHVGYIVSNLEAAMAQLSEATGITWHPPQIFPVDIQLGEQRCIFDVRFTYSKEGPIQVEVAQGPKGTPWDADKYGGASHNGYWTDDLRREIDRLTSRGFQLIYSGVGEKPGPQVHAMLISPWGMRVELIDTVMLPMIETWYATGSFPKMSRLSDR
jgi:hypothetical protein